MIKRLLKSAILATLAFLLVGNAILAAWEYLFPINIVDTSNTTRAYYPVMLGFGGQTLVDAGKISANGTDTNMQMGSQNITYMMSTTNVVAVLPSLPASGVVTASLYTGYSLEQTGFPIITGSGGYVTVADNGTIELGDNFEIYHNALVDTNSGADKNLLYKRDAYRGWVSGSTNITAMIARRVLVFDGTANSRVTCGNIYDGANTLWLSFWLKLNATFDNGAGADAYVWSKRFGANDLIHVRLESTDGMMYFKLRTAGVDRFEVAAQISGANVTSWTGGEWYHIIASISAVNAVRFRVNNSTVVANPDTTAIAAGACPFVIGDEFIGAGTGIVGRVSDFCVGTDDLTPAEETALFNGIAPGDETDFWYMDEGTGVNIVSYGSLANAGTAGVANSWAADADIDELQATVLTTVTGVSLGSHTISVQGTGGGSNLLIVNIDAGAISSNVTLAGQSVYDSGYNYILGQNDVTPYTDNFTMSVNGTPQLYLAPISMLSGTTIPDRAGGDNPGTITWGSNSGITITYGEMSSYESYVATANETGGFSVPSAPMPATWFAGGENVANLPFYDSFFEVASQEGMPPIQAFYFWAIIGVAFGAFLGIVTFTRSALMAYIAMVIVFGVGASMTIIPAWIVFVMIIVGAGIMYLYKQVAY